MKDAGCQKLVNVCLPHSVQIFDKFFLVFFKIDQIKTILNSASQPDKNIKKNFCTCPKQDLNLGPMAFSLLEFEIAP